MATSGAGRPVADPPPDKATHVSIQIHNQDETIPTNNHRQNHSPKNSQMDSLAKLTSCSNPNRSFLAALTGKTSTQDSPSDFSNSDIDYADLKYPTIIEGRQAIIFKVSEQATLVSKFQYTLIGKFSHGKPTWKKIIEFFNQLKLKSDYKVSIFDKKHLYIVCTCKEDFNRLWLRLVWTIDSFAMRIFKWEQNFTALKESSLAPVWIRFEGLPLYMFDKKPLLDLSNAIGKPICVDSRNVNGNMLNSARVCVELDVSKPLVELITLGFVNDSNVLVEERMVQVHYDMVPSYCCICFHIGHSQHHCKRSTTPSVSHSTHRPGKEVDEVHDGTDSTVVVKERGRKITKNWVPKEVTKQAHCMQSVIATNNFAVLADDSTNSVLRQQEETRKQRGESEAAQTLVEPHLVEIADVQTQNEPCSCLPNHHHHDSSVQVVEVETRHAADTTACVTFDSDMNQKLEGTVISISQAVQLESQEEQDLPQGKSTDCLGAKQGREEQAIECAKSEQQQELAQHFSSAIKPVRSELSEQQTSEEGSTQNTSAEQELNQTNDIANSQAIVLFSDPDPVQVLDRKLVIKGASTTGLTTKSWADQSEEEDQGHKALLGTAQNTMGIDIGLQVVEGNVKNNIATNDTEQTGSVQASDVQSSLIKTQGVVTRAQAKKLNNSWEDKVHLKHYDSDNNVQNKSKSGHTFKSPQDVIDATPAKAQTFNYIYKCNKGARNRLQAWSHRDYDSSDWTEAETDDGCNSDYDDKDFSSLSYCDELAVSCKPSTRSYRRKPLKVGFR